MDAGGSVNWRAAHIDQGCTLYRLPLRWPTSATLRSPTAPVSRCFRPRCQYLTSPSALTPTTDTTPADNPTSHTLTVLRCLVLTSKLLLYNIHPLQMENQLYFLHRQIVNTHMQRSINNTTFKWYRPTIYHTYLD